MATPIPRLLWPPPMRDRVDLGLATLATAAATFALSPTAHAEDLIATLGHEGGMSGAGALAVLTLLRVVPSLVEVLLRSKRDPASLVAQLRAWAEDTFDVRIDVGDDGVRVVLALDRGGELWSQTFTGKDLWEAARKALRWTQGRTPAATEAEALEGAVPTIRRTLSVTGHRLEITEGNAPQTGDPIVVAVISGPRGTFRGSGADQPHAIADAYDAWLSPGIG